MSEFTCTFCGAVSARAKPFINTDGVFCDFNCAEEHGLGQAEVKAYNDAGPEDQS